MYQFLCVAIVPEPNQLIFVYSCIFCSQIALARCIIQRQFISFFFLGGGRSSGFTFVNFGMLKEFLNSALHRNLPFCYHKSASINDLTERTIVFFFVLKYSSFRFAKRGESYILVSRIERFPLQQEGVPNPSSLGRKQNKQNTNHKTNYKRNSVDHFPRHCWIETPHNITM